MDKDLTTLLRIASSPLGSPLIELPPAVINLAGPLYEELLALLSAKNGFFAFESALHIFPIGSQTIGYDLSNWNKPELWRYTYKDLDKGSLFFAEDIFGEQFCIRESKIWRFQPETGAEEEMGGSIAQWASVILKDYDVELGYSLARQWQSQNTILLASERLLPKIPFVVGGKYEVANLYNLDAVKGMCFRGEIIAQQIRHHPDGTKIKFDFIDIDDQ